MLPYDLFFLISSQTSILVSVSLAYLAASSLPKSIALFSPSSSHALYPLASTVSTGSPAYTGFNCIIQLLNIKQCLCKHQHHQRNYQLEESDQFLNTTEPH